MVTPVLNRRGTIESCLKSVASQSYQNIEHVVIDGGSTDGTTDLLSEFASSHQISWISEPDTGMYNAINKGLRIAKGDVLAYLNSDDLYLPYTVEVAVSAMRSDRQIVFGDIGLLYAGRSPAFVPHFYRKFDLNYYTHLATLGQPTVFWTRHLMQATGEFDETYRLLGDCEYWLRAATKGFRPAHLEEIMAIAVEHPSTLRRLNPELLRGEFLRLRTEYARTAGPPRGVWRNQIARRLRQRKNQMRLVLAGTRPSGPWPEFRRFLSDRNIAMKKSVLLKFLLPSRVRSRSASLVDSDLLERELFR